VILTLSLGRLRRAENFRGYSRGAPIKQTLPEPNGLLVREGIYGVESSGP
jgi:hypothetical protein